MKPISMKKIAASALCAMALGACAPEERGRTVSAFEGKLGDWAREIVRADPELATARGLAPEVAGENAARRLSDRSPEGEEMRRAAAFRRNVEFAAMDESQVRPDERRTYEIVKAQFAAAAELSEYAFGSLDPLGGHFPYVLDQQNSAFLTLPDFFDSRINVANLRDAENYVERLRLAPAALDGEIARARADVEAGVIPPDFIIDRTLQLLDAMNVPAARQTYASAFRRKLDAIAPAPAVGQAPSPERRRADALYAQAEAIVRDRIMPAQQRTAIFLRSIRPRATHDAGVWRLPNGGAYYLAALRAQTTTDLTPDEIHDIGLARVRELNTLTDAALRQIGLTQGSVGERLAQLTRDPQYQYPSTEEGRAQLIADVNARVEAIMRQAPQWFGTLPRARLEVRRVPAAAEAASSGAYYEAPALDGSLPGVYYINLRNMAEMTRIDLPTQDFHEAVPGHHFQMALAQEQEGLPLLRRLMSFNAYGEGWGLYAEQLADEHDFYSNNPVGRIGYLRWQLWRAARLVVDTGIHAKRWSREQAIDYIVQTTGDQPGVAITEIERYVAWPGQACGYELGRREITRLRDLARRDLGDKFDLKAFHDVVLLGGETPLTVLDGLVHDWIERRR